MNMYCYIAVALFGLCFFNGNCSQEEDKHERHGFPWRWSTKRKPISDSRKTTPKSLDELQQIIALRMKKQEEKKEEYK